MVIKVVLDYKGRKNIKKSCKKIWWGSKKYIYLHPLRETGTLSTRQGAEIDRG